MIIAMDGTIKIDGEPNEVYAEAAQILHMIYETVREHTDEEYATAKLNDIHEVAMMEREELERCAYGVVAGSTLQ